MHLPALPADLLDLPPTRQAAQAGVGKGAREASLRGLDGVWGRLAGSSWVGFPGSGQLSVRPAIGGEDARFGSVSSCVHVVV